MKKLLVILGIMLLFTSCSVSYEFINKHIQENESFYMLDFRPYTEKGFFITQENYIHKYESIGMINYIFMPETNNVLLKDSNYHWVQKNFTYDDGLSAVCNKCLSMGADALINMKIEPYSVTRKMKVEPQKKRKNDNTPVFEQNIVEHISVTIKGYEISGYAIKRK